MTGRSQDVLLVFLLQRLPNIVCFSTLPSFDGKMLRSYADRFSFYLLIKMRL